MEPTIWLQKWFMTLFLYSFPMRLCIRLWDNILVEGILFMFKFPLAIMEIFHDAILEKDLEEINDLFESLNSEHNTDNVQHDPELIITKARNVKVTKKELDDLKKQYIEEMEVDKEKII
jgi:hypothetical protein